MSAMAALDALHLTEVNEGTFAAVTVWGCLSRSPS